MTGEEGARAAETCHALNNLLMKIMGCAHLALRRPEEPQLSRELETILRLAEEAGGCVEELQAVARGARRSDEAPFFRDGDRPAAEGARDRAGSRPRRRVAWSPPDGWPVT